MYTMGKMEKMKKKMKDEIFARLNHHPVQNALFFKTRTRSLHSRAAK